MVEVAVNKGELKQSPFLRYYSRDSKIWDKAGVGWGKFSIVNKGFQIFFLFPKYLTLPSHIHLLIFVEV